MSFLWLIARNVWTKRLRSLLTALAVAVGVITVVVLGIVTDSIRTTAAGVLQVGTADLTVAQQGVNDILQSALTETQLKDVQGLTGVKSAIGVLLDTEKFPAPYFLTANHCIGRAQVAARLTPVWFYDADGKQLCGAYFAYVTRN